MKLNTIINSIKIVVLTACFIAGTLHVTAQENNGSAAPSATTEEATGGIMSNPVVQDVLSTVLFGFLGVIMAVVGFKLFDWIIPADLETEITEKQNVAVAILCAGMLVAVGMIIAGTIVSP